MALIYNEITGEFEEVRNLPQISEFKASVQSLYQGQPFALQWSVGNASVIEIDGERMPHDTHHMDTICDFVGPHRYTLTARNGAEVATRHLQVVALERPCFNLTNSRPRLRRNTPESSTISWDINNALSATLIVDGREEQIALSGNRDFKPDAAMVLQFNAVGLDGRVVFSEQTAINVFDPSHVKFSCNRKYSFPKLPIVLSWKTTGCLEVELLGHGIQPHNGKLVVSPDVTTEYTLRVTDHFGTNDFVVKVTILPLPTISDIMVPAPQLQHIIPISYKTPQFVTVPQLPVLETSFSKLQLPTIPELKDSGYAVNHAEPTRMRLSQRFSQFVNHLFHHNNL